MTGRRWLAVGALLLVLDLGWLAHEVREYRERDALHRLARAGTVEGLAEAVRRSEELRHHLLTNLGNLHLRRGLELRSIAEVRAAVGYYHEALRLRPDLLAAKHNLEIARRVLDSAIPPRQPREPLPPDMIKASEMPLKPNDI